MAFEENEQSKIFPNAAFGYWKVTVERPLRIAGTDPSGSTKPPEIQKLRKEGQRDENAAPIIKRLHPAGTVPDPLHGLVTNHHQRETSGRRVRTRPRPTGHRANTAAGGPGGIDTFLQREVLPYAADAWYTPPTSRPATKSTSTALLQATAHALIG